MPCFAQPVGALYAIFTKSVSGGSPSQIRYVRDPIYILSFGSFLTDYNSQG